MDAVPAAPAPAACEDAGAEGAAALDRDRGIVAEDAPVGGIGQLGAGSRIADRVQAEQ